jgi:hypothetical protein
MATTNPTISTSATKIVNASTDFLLSLPWKSNVVVEVATTNTPSVEPTADTWHPLRGADGDRLNRAVLGNDLEVWARCPYGEVTVVLD